MKMTDGMDSEETDAPQQREYAAGAKLFLVVGLVFAAGYIFTAEGPFRWLELSITVVCLVRSLWYMLQSKRIEESRAESKGTDDKS